jgi:hypothetical protein
MATIPCGLSQSVIGLSTLLSKRAWPLVDAIMAVTQRTISAVLRVLGLSADEFSEISSGAQSRQVVDPGGRQGLVRLAYRSFCVQWPVDHKPSRVSAHIRARPRHWPRPAMPATF